MKEDGHFCEADLSIMPLQLESAGWLKAKKMNIAEAMKGVEEGEKDIGLSKDEEVPPSMVSLQGGFNITS